MGTTEWRPVPGKEGRYEVSQDGAVRSLPRRVEHPLGPKFFRGKILSPRRGRRGRLRVLIEGVDRYVHHLVLEAFVGPRPAGQEGRHLNDNPIDNRLENLAWGTRSQNLHDRVRNGIHHQANKTHCPQGHEYNEANTERGVRGRRCRACRKEARKK